jgi:FixJ family two-component response regulator
VPKRLVEQEAVAAESVDQALDRRVRDAVLACDLAVPGASDLGMQDGLEQVGSAKPIRGREGL